MTSTRAPQAGAVHHAASPPSGPETPKPFAWVSGPVEMAIPAVLLTVVGVGAGVVLGRRTPEQSGARPGWRPASGAPGAPAVIPQLQSLAREVEREDTPPQRLLELAHLAFDQGQFALAVSTCKRMLARDPNKVGFVPRATGRTRRRRPRCLTLPGMAVSICPGGSTEWAT